MKTLTIHEVKQDDLEYHELIDKIDAGAEGNFEDYNFNHLFGNRMRIVIPLGGKGGGSHLNDDIVEKMLAKAGYEVDLEAGVATSEVETERGPQTRKIKIYHAFFVQKTVSSSILDFKLKSLTTII